jgi:gliding motility-associated-like protein
MKNRIQKILLTFILLGSSLLLFADQADFIYSRNCQGSNVVFVSKSTVSSGSITAWEWDFDNDGNFTDATGPKVFKVFSNSGNYQIGLRITNSSGAKTTSYKNVVVNPIATPSFSVNEVCQGNYSSFTDNSTLSSGSISMYKWDFDNDGVFDDSSAANVSYMYKNAGSYSVRHAVLTDSGCMSSITLNVKVNYNPSVQFSFDKTCLYDTTEFLASASVNAGYISTYHWNFDGDAIYEQSSSSNKNTKAFINSGNYQVQVKAVSDKGCAHDTSILVQIAPRPVLNFTFQNFCENNPISIDNSFSNATTYTWNFGDGTMSMLTNPEHTYTNAGIYTISLEGSSVLGCDHTITKDITIYPTPIADFTTEDVCLNDMAYFVNASNDNGSPIRDYHWDFGDYHGDISQNPKHLYEATGLYDVQLITTNHFGCRDTVIKSLEVWALPNAEISLTGKKEFCRGDSAILSINTTHTVLWSTGEYSPIIRVMNSGKYRAIVLDNHFCTSKDSVNIIVHELPEIKVFPDDTLISLGSKIELQAWGGILYNWTPENLLDNPDFSNPVAFPLETTTFTVTGENQFGCQNSADVLVIVDKDYKLDIHNLFSPNGDGVNDVWNIGLSLYEDNEVVIYNRWGVEVFRQKNYADNWDAMYKGEPLPEGSYYYMISFENSDKVYNGSVSILR